MKCKNCKQIIDGNFCKNCGQSSRVDDINVAYVLREFTDSIFQLNKGLFYSIRALFIRPGHAIRDYLDGKRQHLVKPIAYAFALSTIYFLLSKLFESETFLGDALEGWSSLQDESQTDSNAIAIFTWLTNNYAFTMLITLPFYTLSSYLAFKKSGANYFEHFVLNAYITGQQTIIYSISSVFSLLPIKADILSLVTLIASMVYAFVVFWQFFGSLHGISIILRSLCTYVIALVIFIAMIFMSIIIVS